MRNFDFKRYTPRPKKLLRASLNLVFSTERTLKQVRFLVKTKAYTLQTPLHMLVF